MEDQERQEQIERFLSDDLSQEERAAFEARLASDEQLAEELALQQLAHATVAEAGRISLRKHLNVLENEWQQKQKIPHLRKLSRRWLPLAAIILALVVALLWLFRPTTTKPQQLFAETFEPYRSPTPERGLENQTIWADASTAYSKASYELSARLFGESLQTNEDIPDYLAHFYQAISLLAQHPPKATAAIQSLDIVLSSDNDFQQQAQWYKTLALLQLGDTQAAAAMLKNISTPGHYKATEAKKLLEAVQ